VSRALLLTISLSPFIVSPSPSKNKRAAGMKGKKSFSPRQRKIKKQFGFDSEWILIILFKILCKKKEREKLFLLH
jgi:hypothetical protein